MRKQNSDFEARFISEEGSRLKNRDYFGYVELDEFACYVIADGITEITDVESAGTACQCNRTDHDRCGRRSMETDDLLSVHACIQIRQGHRIATGNLKLQTCNGKT